MWHQVPGPPEEELTSQYKSSDSNITTIQRMWLGPLSLLLSFLLKPFAISDYLL